MPSEEEGVEQEGAAGSSGPKGSEGEGVPPSGTITAKTRSVLEGQEEGVWLEGPAIPPGYSVENLIKTKEIHADIIHNPLSGKYEVDAGLENRKTILHLCCWVPSNHTLLRINNSSLPIFITRSEALKVKVGPGSIVWAGPDTKIGPKQNAKNCEITKGGRIKEVPDCFVLVKKFDGKATVKTGPDCEVYVSGPCKAALSDQCKGVICEGGKLQSNLSD